MLKQNNNGTLPYINSVGKDTLPYINSVGKDTLPYINSVGKDTLPYINSVGKDTLFYSSIDQKLFSTTHNNLFLTQQGINNDHSAMIIQNWWRKSNSKTKKEDKASICIQEWWKRNRTFKYYYLFTDNSRFYIEELYDRLLSVVIPGIQYICVKKKDTFPKCILLKTNLHKEVLDDEIKRVLRMIGYNYQFVLNKN